MKGLVRDKPLRLRLPALLLEEITFRLYTQQQQD
jgi:hypothetical protein